MDFQKLISDLPTKMGAIHTLEKGLPVARTYNRLHEDMMVARAALRSWGVKRGTRVGIHAPNSYQWLVHDLALLDIGAVPVAFTEDFDGRLDDAVLGKYGVSLLLIPEAAKGRFPDRPDHVAFLDAPSPNARVLERDFPRHGDEDDHLTLVFSSGSSGGLKGLVISRKGVCATLSPIMDAIGVHDRDRLLLFLPLSNFQQRFLCYAALLYDFDLIVTDFVRLFPAMKQLHPTILLAPPVFYQMVHGEFNQGSAFKRNVRAALARICRLLPGDSLRHRIARLLFRDLYRQFGSRIRLLITGMAPIRRNLSSFFALAQLPLCEAYGMVEAGVMAFRSPGSKEYASVGKPLRGVHFALQEDGELIVTRAAPLTLRYFQCAEGENERTFLAPGRIATGDIGRFGKNGDLFVLGRKGETIVTAAGQKIHPELVERELNNCPDIANSVTFQRPNTAHLSCVVTLNTPADDIARRRILTFVKGLQSTSSISPFIEVIFADAPFSCENGMLRPNMKIDRRNVIARHCGAGSNSATGPRPRFRNPFGLRGREPKDVPG